MSGIAFFAYPTCIRRPRSGGSCRNIATLFGVEKLEWCGYPMVKKFRRYVYSFWHDPRMWQTDGWTDTASRHRPHLCIASRGKNWALGYIWRVQLVMLHTVKGNGRFLAAWTSKQIHCHPSSCSSKCTLDYSFYLQIREWPYWIFNCCWLIKKISEHDLI